MKLRVRFLQLPILFDAVRLADEVAAIPESAWRPHPMKFAGNDALPLITTGGDPSNDARGGAMRATPYLLACPYLMQVFDVLGATWGRSRLMRLSGNAEVTPHVDTDYYWRDHVRIHVPIVTQPTVRFQCGSEQVNMAAGECWAFDTWSLHSVHNDATRSRIHLVADTVGGAGLLDLMEGGRSPSDARPQWTARFSPPKDDGATPRLAYESRNLPTVMTPWEIRDHLGFLLGDLEPGDGRVGPILQALNRFRVIWHSLWAEWGDDEEGRAAYADLLAQTSERVVELGADQVKLINGMSLGLCLRTLIFNAALGGTSMDADSRNSPGVAPAAEPQRPEPQWPDARPVAPRSAASFSPAPAIVQKSITSVIQVVPQKSSIPSWHSMASRREVVFEKPIFIVSSPRSGSTLLFETLAGAPGVFTIGSEAHELIEGIPELTPAAHGWSSNQLSADDAKGVAAARLRERFASALRDRHGRSPNPGPMTMIEKTPKNALRIPFLSAVFPGARFIYLYRDPRPTLASMMEAWASGRFTTYPQLPGWTGLPWSLLLVPGWESLSGAPLNRVVASQWATTTRILLDDLRALPDHRWTSIRYEAFIADPKSVTAELCRDLGLEWDRPLSAELPPSRYTVSAPAETKWMRRSPEIEDVASLFEAEERRAEALLRKSTR
jgi:hypothetical protein